MPIPYPLSNSKAYGGSGGSGLIGYSTIPSTSSYIPGVLSSSQLYFGRHDFSSGRSPMSYGGGGFSNYSVPSPYPHVSAYGVTSPSSYGYGGYTPSSAAKSYYSSLPTITEHSSGNPGSGNKRRNLRTYIPVLPLPSAVGNRPALYTSSGVKTLFTEDIDVTTPRKTAKPGEITRDKNSGGQAPAYGTIRRGRTVIRLETKKLKENPYLAETKNKERGSKKAKENGLESDPIADLVPATNGDPVPSTSQNGGGDHPTPTEDPVEIEKEAKALKQLAKDYSHVTKWYEDEIRKPMKQEKNAGDKFREKYMVHSRKNKYAGYRRPTLSDIRAQKAVVMKEIEERLKKLTNVSDNLPVGDELPTDVKAEAEKLEKDKERLARLDKKMAKRFSRALKKAELVAGGGDSSDDDSIALDRQGTVKAIRKSSSGTIKAPTDLLNGNPADPFGQRLTRKVTKRFFFPEEASSVVQPEIIESLGPAEPEDLFEKKILAQRNTIKMRNTQKKVYNINQRKSSASDLEIPCDLNFGDNKLCDGEEGSGSLPEILEEVGSPVSKQPMTNGIGGGSNRSSLTTNSSGKKKKYVKKVGDPPAKRVPGNILQPLVVPPKDDDSILDSPTEEDTKPTESNKPKKPIGKVNGLIKGLQQESPLKHSLVKNNLKPTFMNPVQNNSVKKFEKQAAVIGVMPGKKAETEVSKIKDIKNKEVGAGQPKAENLLKCNAPVNAILEKKAEPTPPISQEKVTPNTDKNVAPVAAATPNGKVKPAQNPIEKKAQAIQSQPSAEEAEKLPEKPNKSPLIAKLKPKLALDNKSNSLDSNATPKLKMDNKSNSLDGDDQEENVDVNKKQESPNKPKSGEDKTKFINKRWQKPPPNEVKVAKVEESIKVPPVPGKATVSTPAQIEKAKVEDTKEKVVDPAPPKPLQLNKKEKVEDSKEKVEESKATDTALLKSPQQIKKEVQSNQQEQVGKKEETLLPKKVVGNNAKVEEKKVTDIKSPVSTPDVTKKVDSNESSKPPAKQDLLPVKVQEKQPVVAPPKSTPVAEKVEEKKKPAFIVLKPEDKLKSNVKSPPPSPKSKFAPPSGIKDKVVELKKKVPDESKEKQKDGTTSPMSPKSDTAGDDKSESLSSPSPPTSPVANDPSTKPKTVKEKEPKPGQKNKFEPTTSPATKKDTSPLHPLPNGHLSPPSTPKDKCANSSEQPTIPTTGKQQPSKSPQPSETTQKESASANTTGKKTSTIIAKVGNLGDCTETPTNGPEKGKKKDDNDSGSDPVSISQDTSASQMNKLGNLSSPQGTNDEMSALVLFEKSSGDGDDDPDKIINVAVSEKGESDKAINPVIQDLIRKSVRRGSTHSSGGSSISSTSSTLTAKSKSGSGSSTSSSTDGQRRVPSPPIDDDSDEERITLDNCPAKTRPKYRKYEIEDFQFLKVLGKGSFGKVLLAELKATDSYFAIKCLKKDVVLEDDDVECTMIERKVLLMGSKHPYLCHLFCTFQTESHLFFVMEYLNGGDLMFHIQQSGKFTEERARFYGAEIVSGLKFLHKRGVIYRDLKLDNILLDYEGHIRIADFGMCKLQIYLDRMADTFCGTPDYMAPEIIKGLRYNQCVDWWAFGVLLYEMLIGQSPFSGHDEDELFWSVCNEPVHYPRFLSKESKKLLELLLEKDASKRLGTVGCINGDVKEQQFFQPIDWERLEKRDLEPPFKPKLKHSLDVQYFDTTFTKEAARLTPVDKEILRSMDQTQFEGFSYTNPHTTD